MIYDWRLLIGRQMLKWHLFSAVFQSTINNHQSTITRGEPRNVKDLYAWNENRWRAEKSPVKKTGVKKQTTTKVGAKKKVVKSTIKKAPTKGKVPTTKTTLAKQAAVVAAKAEPKKKRKTKNAREHVTISENATKDKFSAMWERVKSGELKWSYYAIDGNVGYHHYLVLKKGVK